MPPEPSITPSSPPISPGRAFADGLLASVKSVFSYTLFATFVGFGALAHDLGFSVLWAALSTILIFAGPAQVISVTMLAAGAPLLTVALAVALSGIRLLPMTVSLLPTLRTPQTRTRDLFFFAHFIAVSTWVETLRLAPHLPRENRVHFCTGIGVGMTVPATLGTVAGFVLAAQLPPLLGAAVLMLTPLSFLVSTARNSVVLSDQLALGLGLVLAPLLAWMQIEFSILIAALAAGTFAYGADRLRRVMA